MYFYPVYRYRNNSDGIFARVGSIKGYAGPIGSRTYASLLREAKRLFAIGAEDVILLGPSPIGSDARASSAPDSTEPAARSENAEPPSWEETAIICP
jgi:hypothetical protein